MQAPLKTSRVSLSPFLSTLQTQANEGSFSDRLMLGLRFFPANRRSWSQPSMFTGFTLKSLALSSVVEFSSGMSPRKRLRLELALAWRRLRPQRPRRPQPLAVTVKVAFCRSESESWISVSPRSLIAAQPCSLFTRDRRLIVRVSLPAFRLFLVPQRIELTKRKVIVFVSLCTCFTCHIRISFSDLLSSWRWDTYSVQI